MKIIIIISTFIAVITAIQLGPTQEPHEFNLTHPLHNNHTRSWTYKGTPTTMVTLPGGMFVQTTLPTGTQTRNPDFPDLTPAVSRYKRGRRGWRPFDSMETFSLESCFVQLSYYLIQFFPSWIFYSLLREHTTYTVRNCQGTCTSILSHFEMAISLILSTVYWTTSPLPDENTLSIIRVAFITILSAVCIWPSS